MELFARAPKTRLINRDNKFNCYKQRTCMRVIYKHLLLFIKRSVGPDSLSPLLIVQKTQNIGRGVKPRY